MRQNTHPVHFMSTSHFWTLLVCMGNVLSLASVQTESIDFDQHIQPVLVRRCIACHGPDQQKGGLRLDLKTTTMKGGKDGPVINVEHPDQSAILQRIHSQDPDLRMPPEGASLSLDERLALRRWIQQGADWPADANNESILYRHWAYQNVTSPTPPPPGENWRVQNPIDLFIQHRLEKQGLHLNPPAERRQLIRRMGLDLTGLPPSWEAVQAFEEDASPSAIDQAINQLLQSPRYGERWGRHWLDVARFNESQGYERDKHRPNAWRYRDYVIRSFNQNKPYDQFVREQIAGDLIEPVNPDGIIATGFLVAGPWDEVGVNQVNRISRKQVREDELEEMIGTLGQTFLATTIHCARCHSHKFDPIPLKDYYRIKSALDGAHHGDRPILTKEERSDYTSARASLESELKTLKTERTSLKKEKDATLNRSIKSLEQKIKDLDNRLPKTYAANPREPDVTQVLARGDVQQPLEPVSAGGLSMLRQLDFDFGLQPDAKESSRRRALAEWVTDPANPLLARVMANRIWHYHFGRGLVITPNDFGQLGARPSHPELLDWLATEFIRSGWDVKHMHRLIMSSATYQQSSAPDETSIEKDAENQWLWRFSPRRVEGEVARDAMLVASGEINYDMEGPGYKSYTLKVNNSHFYTWADHQGATYNRRSVYRTHVQSANDPLMDSLDCPRPSDLMPNRSITTTPLQALTLMNNSVVLRQATKMAQYLEQQWPKNLSQTIRSAFQRTMQRNPSAEELQEHQSLATEHGLSQVCWVLLNSSEFLYMQ